MIYRQIFAVLFFFFFGFVFVSADTVDYDHICGYYTDSGGQNCSYSSLVTGYTGGNIYRNAGSFTTGAFSGTATGDTIVLGTSTDGTLCNSGACQDWVLYQFSSSVDNTLTWGTQPSSTLVDNCSSNAPATNQITCDISSLTLSPSTTYYFQFRRANEASVGDSYTDNPAVGVVSYTLNSSTSSTSSLTSFGLWGAIATTSQDIISTTATSILPLIFGVLIALFALFFIAVGLTKGFKRLLR